VAANAQGSQPVGTPLYSDLGYILVGAALEKASGKALDELIHEHITGPWSLKVASARAFIAAREQFPLEVAPTEVQLPRGGVLRGTVHDDNAWTLSGWKCSGHAGLFGTLEAMLHLGTRLLDGYQSELVRPLIEPRPGGSLRMGFDSKGAEKSAAGALASWRTFGHLGFTGTSFWCDPEKQRVTVLLSNRVHPTRAVNRLAPLRSQIHDFLWGC
jgi:CubicO group peptidase (beta-lactamase class C family)